MDSPIGDAVPRIPITLLDGTPVVLQPVQPGDRDRMRGGFARLSPKSRQQRFFRGLTELSEADLDYLTIVDQHVHVAWGAVDPSQAGEPGLGMGRFIREADDPTVAEMAIAVEFQGRGLGTFLLAVLALRAEAIGVRTLRALTLLENDAVSHWLRGLGASMHFDGQVCDFRLPVGPEAVAVPVPGRRKPPRRPRPPIVLDLPSRSWYEWALRDLRPHILGTPTVPRPSWLPPTGDRRRPSRSHPPAPWNRLKGGTSKS
jgi:GNAT superfamily N-acetyltransferase